MAPYRASPHLPAHFCPPGLCLALAMLAVCMLRGASAQERPETPPRAAAVAIAPQQGVLLLRNGRTLHGKFTRDGDRYYLALPGGEIRIRVSEVELACDSLDACYAYRRQRVDAGNVNSHLDLAQWCIEHNLLGPAAEQLGVAISIDPRHPKLVLLERRLEAARAERRPVEPADDLPADYLNPDAIDKFCRALPQGTVETFTNRIHPLLQNHCGNAGCHGAQSPSPFRMYRLPGTQAASNRLTQRNLYAVLQMVNRENPPASPLLTVPIKPHGDQKAAVFKSHDVAQYNELVQWVVAVCGRPAKAAPATLGLNPPALMQPQLMPHPMGTTAMLPGADSGAANSAATNPGSDTKPLPEVKPRLERATDPALPGAPAAKPIATQAIPSQTTVVQATANDPFHPELFNRRYFPQGNPRTRQAAEPPPMPEPPPAKTGEEPAAPPQ